MEAGAEQGGACSGTPAEEDNKRAGNKKDSRKLLAMELRGVCGEGPPTLEIRGGRKMVVDWISRKARDEGRKYRDAVRGGKRLGGERGNRRKDQMAVTEENRQDKFRGCARFLGWESTVNAGPLPSQKNRRKRQKKLEKMKNEKKNNEKKKVEIHVFGVDIFW